MVWIYRTRNLCIMGAGESPLVCKSMKIVDVAQRAGAGLWSTAEQDMSAVTNAVLGWFNTGLGLIYPQVCQLCAEARATPREGYGCSGCRSEACFIERPFCQRCGLPFEGEITQPFECSNCQGMEWHFRSARSSVVARGKVLDVIHRYKYQRALWFE